jgi:hypothetical protein
MYRYIDNGTSDIGGLNMKRTIVSLFVFICTIVAFMGTALAGSAPSAMSYFSNQVYNKDFVDDQGITHTAKASQVSEIWNKAGSVMYIIQTKETYTDAEGNDHIEIRDDTKIFANACPKYPDSQRQTVYRAEWYPDGHSQVVYDYRPAATPTPAPASSTPVTTPSPTIQPTAKPTAMPKAKPTVKPTAKSTAKPTLEPTASPTAAPTASSADSVAVSTATPFLYPSPTPTPSAIPSSSPTPIPTASPSPITASVSSGSPEVTDALFPMTAMPAQSGEHAADSMWWGVAGVALIVLAIVLLCLMLHRRRKEKIKNEVDEA